MTNEEIEKRANSFFNQLNLSETTTRNYRSALNSIFLKDMLYKEWGLTTVFAITDLESLWQIYSKINLHPQNVSKHRIYSAAIMKYIRFLNQGLRYGKRIDFGKSR